MSEALAQALCFFLNALPEGTAEVVRNDHNPNNSVIEGTLINGDDSKKFRVTVEEMA